MKWLLIGVGIVLAAAAASVVVTGCRKRAEKSTDDIDGGVVKRYWNDAPKIIESTEILEFHCEISLFAVCDVDDLGYRVYSLDAVESEDGVAVKYSWYDRQGGSDKGEYAEDADFLVRLQNIVAKYDFAKNNGYYHTVSGLPDMYGESLDITYAGGERIYVHDNQSGFLQTDAVRELITLFGAATKMEN